MFLNNDGANWNIQGNWLGYGDHCSWEGVACSNESFVTELALQNNQLSGSFPPDLINLDNLSSLDLSANALIGIIPEDLCYRSTSDGLYIHGDVANCENTVPAGCCDLIYGLS